MYNDRYIYLTMASVVCRLHADDEGSDECAPAYDVSRFHAYRRNYVLMLDVKAARLTDAGLYICAQPPLYSTMGELGLIGVVGVVRE